MTAKKPPPKGKGILWRWLDAVDEHLAGDDDLTSGQRRHVMAIASLRARYADPNGANCRPSKVTLASRCMIKRDDVQAADRWLEDHELMRVTNRSGLGGVKVYRLEVPHDFTFEAEKDAPDRGQVQRSKMPPTGDKFTTEDAPELAPEVVPSRGHNLQPPNVSKEGEVGAHAHSPSSAPLRSVSAAHLDSGQRATAFRLIADAVKSKPAAWRDISRSHDKLIVEAHRLTEGGWTSEQISLRLDDLPEPRKVNSKSGFIAQRLEKLPTDPADDETLMDALADDPLHVARQIATICCNTLHDIWKPYDGDGVAANSLLDREPPINDVVIARIFDTELQASPRMRDEALEKLAQYEFDDGEGDRTIIEKIAACLTFVGRGDDADVAQAKRMDQLRSVHERLPEIIETVADELTRPF